MERRYCESKYDYLGGKLRNGYLQVPDWALPDRFLLFESQYLFEFEALKRVQKAFS